MCGRYRLTAKERYIRDHFGLDEDVEWSPRWNIAPTQQVPTICQDAREPRRVWSMRRWGLIPSWAKDSSIGFKTINAVAVLTKVLRSPDPSLLNTVGLHEGLLCVLFGNP
jgi:putative SOS response-associated peptidase YedK